MDFGQTHAPSWLNASYYSNVPYNEVNWAALAQQWIAMRQTGDNLGAPAPQVVHQQTAPPPLPSCQPPSQPPAPPTGFESPVYPPNTADFVSQRLDQCFETPLAVGNLASEQIRGPVRNSGPLLATPEMPPMPDAYIIDRSRPERFIPPKPLFQPVRHRFPRYPFETSKAQDFTADSYNMMSAGYYGENESFYTDSMYSQAAFEPATGHFYPPQGASGHFSAHDMDYRKWSGFMANQKSWMMDDRSSSNSPDVPLIDNQQRKLLPAWIREGLEKVEKEKQKKQEEEMRKAQAEAQKDAGRDNKPNKGRFESDSESEGEDEPTTSNREEEETEKLPRKLSPVQKRISRFEPSPQSEEEYKEKLLLLLRRWMTEILLEVTDNEIRTISSEFHSKIRRKAQPKMLAQSSALAAISSFGEGAESGESSGEDLEEESGASEKEEDNKQENEEESREGFKRPLEPFSSVIRPVSKQRKQISLGSEPQPKSFKDGEKEQLVVDIGDNTDAAKEKLVGKEVKKSSMSKDKRSRSRSRSPRERKEAKRRYRSRSRSRSPSRERGSHHSHRERDRRKRSRSKERDRDRKHRKDERRKRSDHK